MQMTETVNEGLKRAYKVTIPASDLEQKMASRLKELAATLNMPGFRRGKVPVHVVKRRFGASLRSEILEKVMTDSSKDVLSTQTLRPAMQPQIDIESSDQDLVYTLELEILPDIEIQDFSVLSLEKPVITVDDEMITDRMTRLAESQRVHTSVERAAQDGDAVILDFAGRIDGQEFEGGSGEGHQLILGSKTFIPGFEEQLVGASAGDEKDVTVTFPEDYGAENLAGKEAVFACHIQDVQEGETPELTDTFAESLGMDSLDALKEAVSDQVKREHDSLTRRVVKRRLLDALADSYDFDVPTGLVDLEFSSIWKDLMSDMEAKKETFDSLGQTEEETRTEYQNVAERRVRLGLLLSEVGRVQDIEITEEEINREIIENLRRFPGQEQQIYEMFRSNPQAREGLKAPIMEEKVVDYILELAQVTETSMSLDDLIALDQEDSETEPVSKGQAPEIVSDTSGQDMPDQDLESSKE